MTAFDLETTGIDPTKDRIIQIATIRMGVTGEMEPWQSLVNPERLITAEITELTGITNEMVSTAPTFRELVPEVVKRLNVDTLVGFGCHRFDIPLLDAEFNRAGVTFVFRNVIDAGELFKIAQPRTLSAAVQTYLNRPHDGAHNALADARAAIEVLNAMVGRHEQFTGKTAEELDLLSRHGRRMADPAGKLSYDELDRLCYAFGKSRGVPVGEDTSYAYWMLRSDFPASTKAMLTAELDRIHGKTPSMVGEGVDDDGLPF